MLQPVSAEYWIFNTGFHLPVTYNSMYKLPEIRFSPRLHIAHGPAKHLITHTSYYAEIKSCLLQKFIVLFVYFLSSFS